MLYAVGSHLGVGTVTQPTPPTEMCADVVEIIEDFDETMSVYRRSNTYDSVGMATESWGLQGTILGDWQPVTGSVMRMEQGLKIKSDAFIITGCNVDVQNDDKIYRSDSTFEYVNYVKKYSGHTTIFMTKQKGAN